MAQSRQYLVGDVRYSPESVGVEEFVPRQLLLWALGVSDKEHVYMSNITKPPKRRDVYVLVLLLIGVEIRAQVGEIGSGVGVQVSSGGERPPNQTSDDGLF